MPKFEFDYASLCLASIDSLGKAWLISMSHVMKSGKIIKDDGVRLKEVSDLSFFIESITEDDPILLQSADRDRIALMKQKYATCGLVGEYTKDYGSYLYDTHHDHVDQIEWVIKRIKNKPESKSATVLLSIPGEEFLPCLSGLNFQLRDDSLNMVAYYRSQNVFASQPGNVLALRQIQSNVSAEIGGSIGRFLLHIGSAHIYEKDFDSVEKILRQYDLIT